MAFALAGGGACWVALRLAQRLARRRHADSQLDAQATVLMEEAFDVSPHRGFLGVGAPCQCLPMEHSSAFEGWERLAAETPMLIRMGRLRRVVKQLPPLDWRALRDANPPCAWQACPPSSHALWRAYAILTLVTNAYVWQGAPDDDRSALVLPSSLATPLRELAAELRMPAGSTLSSTSLWNWQPRGEEGVGVLGPRRHAPSRDDRARAWRADDHDVLLSFTRSVSEAWFDVCIAEVDGCGGPALLALVKLKLLLSGEHSGDEAVTTVLVARYLRVIPPVLRRAVQALHRIPEKCRPAEFQAAVRQWTGGWRRGKAFPRGLGYETPTGKVGRLECGGVSGAQSPFFAALDAALGVAHGGVALGAAVERAAPPSARAFLQYISELWPTLRTWLAAPGHAHAREAYNEAIAELAAFCDGYLTTMHELGHQGDTASSGSPASSLTPSLSLSPSPSPPSRAERTTMTPTSTVDDDVVTLRLML